MYAFTFNKEEKLPLHIFGMTILAKLSLLCAPAVLWWLLLRHVYFVMGRKNSFLVIETGVQVWLYHRHLHHSS